MATPLALRVSLALALLLAACTGGGEEAPSPVPTAPGLRWETLAQMPTPRSEVAAASDGERIVVAGGFDETGASVGTVEILDLATAAWSPGPDLPLPVNHPMAAGFDGTVVVLGGYLGPGLANPTDRAFALRDGAWEELPPMPEPRGAGGAAVVDGRLYVAGGVGPAGLAADGFVFDPDAGAWSTIEGPPTGREHLGVAGFDGELFVVGGRTGGIGSNLDAAEALEAGAGSWRELPQMPTARGGSAAAATSNGYVVSAGGEADSTFDEAEAFDVRADRWLALPRMPTARHDARALGVGGRRGDRPLAAASVSPAISRPRARLASMIERGRGNVLIFPLLLVLAGCGGTEGGDSAAPPPASNECEGAATGQPFPEVLDVTISREGDAYRLAVTLSSPYDSPERYADGWRIMDKDGRTLAEHTLLHDHATEQPFTRTQSRVAIPGDVGEVIVEGRDLCNGYGGSTLTVPVPRSGDAG